MALNRVTAYTDGACSGNPGPGGYGVVLLNSTGVFEFSAHVADTTSNRMEILAAVSALNRSEPADQFMVFSDSKYVVNIGNLWLEGWRRSNWRKSDGRPVANVDLLKDLVAAIARHERVDWRWVRGHAGNQYNERADQLARRASTGREVSFGPAGDERRAGSSTYTAISFDF